MQGPTACDTLLVSGASCPCAVYISGRRVAHRMRWAGPLPPILVHCFNRKADLTPAFPNSVLPSFTRWLTTFIYRHITPPRAHTHRLYQLPPFDGNFVKGSLYAVTPTSQPKGAALGLPSVRRPCPTTPLCKFHRAEEPNVASPHKIACKNGGPAGQGRGRAGGSSGPQGAAASTALVASLRYAFVPSTRWLMMLKGPP